jgi:hypothetical protein
VVVWLGIASGVGVQSKIPEAISMLDTIGNSGKSVFLRSKETGSMKTVDADELAIEERVLNALVHILDNPWYRRVWV